MNPFQIILTTGMKGEPLPYMLRTDWVVTCIIFVCLISLFYTIAKAEKHLQQKIKAIFSSRERASLFDDATATDAHYSLALVLQTCILSGIGIYHFISYTNPAIIKQYSHFVLLIIFTLTSIVFLIAKLGLYAFVNWIFFKKDRNLIWMKTYVNVVICLGLLLFPTLLLDIYFEMTPQFTSISTTIVIISFKILLFWKCFNNFFNKIHGFFHLILYFCALEIVPDLIIWKSILVSCNKLIINI